jgi:hypothetical protein
MCAVCGESADDDNSAICNWCGLRFHLGAAPGPSKGKDSASRLVNDAYMALEYACQACLRGEPPPDEDEPAPGAGR